MAIPEYSEHYGETVNVISGHRVRIREFSPRKRVKTKVLPPFCITFLISLIVPPTIVNCSLIEIPQNIAVANGSGHVEFRCKSDGGYKLNWFMQSPSVSERQVLYDGNINHAKPFCRVKNGEPGKFYLNLTIKEEAAQTYTCEEPGRNNEFSADLIIMMAGSESIRSEKSVIDDRVLLTCSVGYRGNWAPELEWSFNGASIEEGVNSTIIPNEMVSSVLVLPLNASVGNYTCTARFDIRGKPPQTKSTNVPDYISTSVLTVEASQLASGNQGSQFGVTGSSTGLVIGLVVIGLLVLTVVTIVTIFRRRMCNVKRRQRNVEMDPKKETRYSYITTLPMP